MNSDFTEQELSAIFPSKLNLLACIAEFRNGSAIRDVNNTSDVLDKLCKDIRDLYHIALMELQDSCSIDGDIIKSLRLVDEAKRVFYDDPLVFLASASLARNFLNDDERAKAEIGHALAISRRTGNFFIQSNIELLSILINEHDIIEIENALKNIIEYDVPTDAIDESIDQNFIAMLENSGCDGDLIANLWRKHGRH
jgi:hypothetical protein